MNYMIEYNRSSRTGKTSAMERELILYLKKNPKATIAFASREGIRIEKWAGSGTGNDHLLLGDAALEEV